MSNNNLDDLDFLFKRLRSNFMINERDAKHLNWVRSQPCAKCGNTNRSEAHHVFGSMGSLKSSDYTTIPLCNECHQWIEQNPRENKTMIELLIKIFYIKGKQQ